MCYWLQQEIYRPIGVCEFKMAARVTANLKLSCEIVQLLYYRWTETRSLINIWREAKNLDWIIDRWWINRVLLSQFFRICCFFKKLLGVLIKYFSDVFKHVFIYCRNFFQVSLLFYYFIVMKTETFTSKLHFFNFQFIYTILL